MAVTRASYQLRREFQPLLDCYSKCRKQLNHKKNAYVRGHCTETELYRTLVDASNELHTTWGNMCLVPDLTGDERAALTGAYAVIHTAMLFIFGTG